MLILIIQTAAKPSNNTLERCVRVKGQGKSTMESMEGGLRLRRKKSDNWDRSYHRVRPDERSPYDCHERVWPGGPTVLSLYSQSKHGARSAHCYFAIAYNLTSHRYSIQIQSMIHVEPEQLQIIMVMLQVEVMLTVVSYRSRDHRLPSFLLC